MLEFDVEIEQITSGSWHVSGGNSALGRVFRSRDHALAFGRALAYSKRSDLYLCGPDGASIRQKRSSLTYPATL